MGVLCSNALLSGKASMICLEADVTKILLDTGWVTAGNVFLPGKPLTLCRGSACFTATRLEIPRESTLSVSVSGSKARRFPKASFLLFSQLPLRPAQVRMNRRNTAQIHLICTTDLFLHYHSFCTYSLDALPFVRLLHWPTVQVQIISQSFWLAKGFFLQHTP